MKNKGKGYIQQFIDERGGAEWITEQYKKHGSCAKIAEMIWQNWGILCSSNTIRVYMQKHNIPRNSCGGDRRSKKQKNKKGNNS